MALSICSLYRLDQYQPPPCYPATTLLPLTHPVRDLAGLGSQATWRDHGSA